MMPAWSRNSPANSAILIWIGFLVKPTAPEAIPSGSPSFQPQQHNLRQFEGLHSCVHSQPSYL